MLVFNVFLWLMFQFNHAFYDQLIQNGATWFTWIP